MKENAANLMYKREKSVCNIAYSSRLSVNIRVHNTLQYIIVVAVVVYIVFYLSNILKSSYATRYTLTFR